MVSVILIRHGETDWNKQQIFRGRIDVDLNEVGFAQAKAVAAALQDVKVDAIYSSSLSRALNTAKMLGGERNLKVEIEDGFIDIDFGRWQGLAHREVREKYGELYQLWLAKPHRVQFPQGESLEEVKTRSQESLERVMALHPEGRVAVVSHRVLNKALLCTVLGLDLSRFWHIKQDTCAINMWEYREGNYYLTLLNDTCHLKRISGASGVDF